MIFNIWKDVTIAAMGGVLMVDKHMAHIIKTRTRKALHRAVVWPLLLVLSGQHSVPRQMDPSLVLLMSTTSLA